MTSSPPWGEPTAPAATLVCPKCRGAMRTYERNGVHVDQCENCRGIFLDVGELEALTRLESKLAQPAPPPPAPAPQPGYAQPYPQQYPQPGYGPGWGHHGSHRYRKGGFGRLFFSS